MKAAVKTAVKATATSAVKNAVNTVRKLGENFGESSSEFVVFFSPSTVNLLVNFSPLEFADFPCEIDG